MVALPTSAVTVGLSTPFGKVVGVEVNEFEDHALAS
jgi:hypothetical protein